METNARICRALFEAQVGRPEMNRRQRQREDRILAAGQLLMAQYGRHGVTFRILAGALRIGTRTLAWHYVDLDALLGEILRTYLQTLHTILGEVPFDHENRQPALRAAYLKAIQRPFGGLTPLHTLLTRDRHLLPEDELATINPIIQGLGELLAGDLGPEALDLLERPWIDHPQAEALLATIATMRSQPASLPQPAAIPQQSPVQAAPPPAEPPARPLRPLQYPRYPTSPTGQSRAMTAEELDAADNEAAAPPPNVPILLRPKHSLAEASAP